MKKKHVTIIAEAGVNHNGSLDMAMELVQVAANAGADIVKFQTFKADNLVTHAAPKANYQKELTKKNESQWEMLKKYELNLEGHRKLLSYCQEKQIEFLSSPFDVESLWLLTNDLGLDKIKVPSGEITNGPLLLKMAQLKNKVLLSTGMSTLSEVKDALAVLAYGFTNENTPYSLNDCYIAFNSKLGQMAITDKVSLLHCTSEYPAPYADVNLRAIDTMRESFGLSVGLSDHTPGISIPIAAVARGAVIIEKHFTLDKNLPGPDHQASLDPKELKEMIVSIRQVEEALGDGDKKPAASELKNRDIVRKSLVAMQNINEDDLFSENNLGMKRPGYGVTPMRFWEKLGKTAKRIYKKEGMIE